MPTVRLTDRAIINVAGPDAEHLLQNVITTDLDALKDKDLKPGALLAPQGKILFDFLISRAGENALRIDVRADVADDLVRRLILYRLRAKAEVSKLDQADVIVSWDNDSGASENDSSPLTAGEMVVDTRFRDVSVIRTYASGAQATDDANAWTRLRIEHGIAESGTDYGLGDAFPHDVLLDETGGIGLRKGCYVGQEVVSRMQHRGTARRRALIMTGDSPLPASGTPITANGREVGALGSVDDAKALAIVRIDRIKEALDAGTPILAGEVAVSPSIPAWAKFTYPQAAKAEDA
ncbi:YgfZ/GcvT domain-containing protein [Arvimicrobium flavum]|uniref:CAF17-like 4Fe-4S cluster assembly/insertion protein YgfZ n=1 Tax=Arvimicrobium flavum TaxID=3393320 RepID=UPI00237BF3C7|nr:folate-binding protein YgfZ [Mesorhizobium shangrilense]